jgi:GntR family transcriptional repressor for pyruvate dehydrogenase complex
MSEALRPMVKSRLYEQVLERLREHVSEAGLKAGDKLPAERDLAASLGVSRASVKQAIVVLEVQGLVEARHGGGTYLVRDTLDVEPVEQLVERRKRLPEVLEAREALETKLAELAAERRTDAELEDIRQALDFMRDEIAEGANGVEGDRRFRSLAQHTAIYEAIAASDPKKAAAAMRKHVRTVAKVRLLTWVPED